MYYNLEVLRLDWGSMNIHSMYILNSRLGVTRHNSLPSVTVTHPPNIVQFSSCRLFGIFKSVFCSLITSSPVFWYCFVHKRFFYAYCRLLLFSTFFSVSSDPSCLHKLFFSSFFSWYLTPDQALLLLYFI
jgi:hypothetical protein